MGSFSIDVNTTNGKYNIASSNGVAVGSTAQLAIGAHFTIRANGWTFGGCSANIDHLIFSCSSNDLVPKYDSSGNDLSSCTFDKCFVDNVPSYTWNPFGGFLTTTTSVEFFAGKTSGSQIITLQAFYTFGGTGGTFSETVNFNLNVQSPTTNNSLSFVHPTVGSANDFQFGPFQISHNSGASTIYDYTPIADWGDTNYLSGLTGVLYGLGCGYGGVTPIQVSGTGTNSTSSDGVFYCQQLVLEQDPSNSIHAHSSYTSHYFSSIGLGGSDFYFNVNPIPASQGQTVYGLDEPRGNSGSYPWAWQGVVTNASAGSGALAVPPANSTKDINGNNHSFYPDGPSRMSRGVGGNFTDVFIERNLILKFHTYLIWQPTGGIPIAMEGIDWELDCFQYNANADSSLNSVKGRCVAANWDGFGVTGPIYGSKYVGPIYFQWNYIVQDYINYVQSSKPRMTAVPGGTTNTGPIGLSPIGGGPHAQGMFGPKMPEPMMPGFGGLNRSP